MPANLAPFAIHERVSTVETSVDSLSELSGARVKVLSALIKDENFTTDGATQSKSVGTVPAGAFVLGVCLTVNEGFALAGAAKVRVTALTVGGIDIMPAGLDNFDIQADDAPIGTVGASALFRPAEGAATVTIVALDGDGDPAGNLNSLTLGELSVKIVYFVPE